MLNVLHTFLLKWLETAFMQTMFLNLSNNYRYFIVHFKFTYFIYIFHFKFYFCDQFALKCIYLS